MQKKSQQSGFSLVELMVVVAIIGILATIAIPKVNKFVAKSRQSEAQINLSSIYTFNKNFYLEFQGYTNAFSAMGYAPEGNLRYNSGWSQGPSGPTNYTTLTGRNYEGATSTLAACPSNAGDTAACRTLRGADDNEPAAVTGSIITVDSFTAAATACLVKGSGACIEDRWTINQDKNLRNIQSGID